MRWLLPAVLFFAVFLSAVTVRAGPPLADESASERAAELKKRGDELMVSLQYRDALDAYAQAYALNADPALLYNRARAHQALTEYPQALDLLEVFAESAPPELKARVPMLQELLAEIRARVATLDVRSNVEGARVFIREKVEATLPSTDPIRVRAGGAKIEVRADGYVPFTKEMFLPGGRVTTIDARLVPHVPDGKAVLTVTTSPPSGLVFVDGRPLGTAPAEAALEAGRHAVLVQGVGYEDSRLDVELANGQRRTMDVPMKKRTGILARWWFWTGVGVVVVSGILVVYALTTTSDPPSGTIPPGQVRGPLTIGF